jgi:hypothetical protein
LINPEVAPGGGRLYLYWQFGRPGPSPSQNVLGLNYNVTIDDGSITQAMNYQHPDIGGFLGPRWQPVMGNPAPNPAVNPGGNTQRFTAININAFGLRNDAAAVALDTQYDTESNSTILGYVDVAAPGFATVWITVDVLGIAIQGGGPLDEIYLGFGDDPVHAGAHGMRSEIPEATIVPEPATLMLLACAGLVLRRRR